MAVEAMKARLAGCIKQWILDNDMTQTDTAQYLGTTQGRISQLVNGKLEHWSLEALVRSAKECGFNSTLEITA